jgi:CRP-like cAMP-binding protein
MQKHIDLSGHDQSKIKSYFKIRRLKKKQFLLNAGDVCRLETFVAKGLLRSFQILEDGSEAVAMFGSEGWWISDLYSFLTETPATQNIEAIEDSEVLCIEKKELDQLYREVPQLERMFRILLQNAFVANQKRVLDSISQSAEERYLAFIQKYPDLEKRLSQQQVSLYLGITPETISRIRKNQMRKN